MARARTGGATIADGTVTRRHSDGAKTALDPAFLINRSRGTVLATQGEVLRDPFRQAIGTMFRALHGGLVFVWWRTGRIAITNVFVPVDIDVVWLDETGRVVSMTKRFRRGAFHTVNEAPARYVVELPAGTLERSQTREGDRIICTGITWMRT